LIKVASVQGTAVLDSSGKNSPLISVVITTKNEERNLENCLCSVKNQSYRHIEIIVVDNFSDDRTREIAQKYTTKVFLKGNERSAQRNFGAEVANGKYLIYLDADMILCTSLLEECVSRCECGEFDACYVPERNIGEGFWIRVRNFERSFYTGTVIDAVRFVRRELFLKAGGFNEALVSPEDLDFDRKIREIGRVGIACAPLYHNEGRFNVKRYVDKKRYYTSGIKKYTKKWGKNSETMKQIGVQYRLIGVFFEQGKWKRLLRNLPFTVAMYWLRFNVALAYLGI